MFCHKNNNDAVVFSFAPRLVFPVFRLLILAVAFCAMMPFGCFAAAAQPTVRVLQVDGRERQYEWFAPDAADGRALPVILAFHGGGKPYGSGGRELDRYIDLTAQATKAGFIVVYPDGYKHSWNAGPGPDGKSPNWGPAFEENVDDVKFIRVLLDDLARVAPVDPRRIYAAGISNGSAMSYRLAIEMPDRIAAVSGVASELSLRAPVKAVRPVPVMHFWGTEDPIARAGAPSAAERTQRNIEAWKRINGCSNEKEVSQKGPATKETYLGCKAPVILWTVKGMGHTWPGVTAGPLLRMELGPSNLDISASAEMISFFLQHPLQ